MSDLNDASATSPASGWYPTGDGTERWWDGTQWGDATRPVTAAAGAQPAAPETHTPAPAKRNNIMGIIAVVVAGLGFVFSCVPGFLVLGWILLPIGFTLGIIAVCLRGRSKWAGITAILLAVVGTITAIIVAISLFAGAVSENFGSGQNQVTTAAPSEDPASDESDASAKGDAAPEEKGTAAGTREQPLPFNSVVENDDWTVSLTAFNGNANADVEAANMFNEKPAEGQVWVILDLTAAYKGDGEGSSLTVEVDYVTAEGVVISSFDNMVSGIDPRFGTSSLYAGASDTGRLAFLVPATLDGVIRVKPGLFADEVFYSLP